MSEHRCRFPFAVLAVVLALPVSTAAQTPDAKPPHPTLEDLFRVKALGGLQVSPGRGEILYTVRTVNLQKNEANTDIWLLNLSELAD